MKLINIDGQNLYIFWMAIEISMKFFGKIWLIAILKVTKDQGLTLYLEDTNFKKNTGMVKLTPPPAFQGLKMMKNAFHFIAQYLTM